MGMVSLILAIVAILLAGLVFFQNTAQNSAIQEIEGEIEENQIEISGKQTDLSQCDLVSPSTLEEGEETSCNQVCGSRQCILAYRKNILHENSPVTRVNNDLIECDENTGIGSFDPEGSNTVQRLSLDCICCN